LGTMEKYRKKKQKKGRNKEKNGLTGEVRVQKLYIHKKKPQISDERGESRGEVKVPPQEGNGTQDKKD